MRQGRARRRRRSLAESLRLLVACAGVLFTVFASGLPIACALDDLRAASVSPTAHHEHPAGEGNDAHREHCPMCQAPTAPPPAPAEEGLDQPPRASGAPVTVLTSPRGDPGTRRTPQPRAPPASGLA